MSAAAGTGPAAPGSPRTLVLIPARGGSKGIPRKNLRSLGGRPLLSYVVKAALGSRHSPDVVVSSEDDEILALARGLGARVHRRDAALSGDAATLDQVVAGSVEAIEHAVGRRYDVVVTVQPTSPLLTTASLDEVIDRFWSRPIIDTVLTVVDDRHLRWIERDGALTPAYEARVNRQALPPTYRETGGLIACRREQLATGTRIGPRVAPLVLSGGEAVDIDSREDWALCEWYLSRRDILFVVAGWPEIGLGHVANALTLANELVTHRVRFLVTAGSDLARDVIASSNYEVHRQATDDLVEEILTFTPDVVVNDRLDTDADEIRRLKAAGLTVVNFEDLGSGAREADVVINAIYPEREPVAGHHFGARWFCLRQEFSLAAPRPAEPVVRRVLLTFGGVDPNNLTCRVLEAIHAECVARGIEVEVVAGRGYAAWDTLATFDRVRIERAVPDMAERMRGADIAFTSAGRTIFEVAALGTPTIVLAQNEREMSHLFASEANGFMHLGLGSDVPVDAIRRAFIDLVEDPGRRGEMQRRMLDNDLRGGTARVVRLLSATIGEP